MVLSVMVRPLRIEYPGAVFHITSRGNAREKIYSDDLDRENFLFTLASVVSKYNWLCHAYCLMDNHYHLMIETVDATLSLGMRQLNGIYTQRYNRRHGKTGHIFQGRFKSILLEKESHLAELCRYVILNPVRAGMVSSPDEWEWSSYPSTAGISKCPDYLSISWILELFGAKKSVATTRYRQFVAEGINKKSPWTKLEGQTLLGGEAFVEKFKAHISDQKKIKEISKKQRFAGRPGLAAIFEEATGHKNHTRNRAIYDAHMKHGYTLKDVADYLGIHYTTVSKVVRQIEEKT